MGSVAYCKITSYPKTEKHFSSRQISGSKTQCTFSLLFPLVFFNHKRASRRGLGAFGSQRPTSPPPPHFLLSSIFGQPRIVHFRSPQSGCCVRVGASVLFCACVLFVCACIQEGTFCGSLFFTKLVSLCIRKGVIFCLLEFPSRRTYTYDRYTATNI